MDEYEKSYTPEDASKLREAGSSVEEACTLWHEAHREAGISVQEACTLWHDAFELRHDIYNARLEWPTLEDFA
jgi:methionine aminopeptidase